MENMQLIAYGDMHFAQLKAWITSERLCYQWGGPTFRYPLTAIQMRTHCQQQQVLPFMCTLDGQPVGFVELYQQSNRQYRVCRVFISPEFRGQHLADRMLVLLMNKAKETLNAQSFTLGVFSHNHAAIACYQRLGFSEYQRLPDRIRVANEQWELIRMYKTL